MIEIYTDGATCGNGRPDADGAWSFVTVFAGQVLAERVGKLTADHVPHTNNKAEMEAVRQAMLYMIERQQAGEPPHPFKILSDSRYVVDGMNSWTKTWRKRGWVSRRKGKEKPIKNLSMWQELRAMADSLPVSFQWVRGHNGNQWNGRADELAEGAVDRLPKVSA